MTGKIFSPLLVLLAKLSESELLHTIQFLRAEKRKRGRRRKPEEVRELVFRASTSRANRSNQPSTPKRPPIMLHALPEMCILLLRLAEGGETVHCAI